THREFFDIDDFILFSKNGIKFYNRIVDYKPYTVSSFVYGATIEAVSGKESLRERFWRPFLFSFVFAREYAFRDVLYVPFGECPIEWDRRFLDVECSAVSIYFPFSKDMLEALPCGVGAVSPLSLRIYIPHQFMFAFFDAAFVEPAFFDREWVDVLCDIVLP
ncbi:MAG: hypothetical protein NZM05_12665, partial [Chloroherpetonaceae bacterium]|nr:hypothetical protein [Chloroherpetonaceae bacterium]